MSKRLIKLSEESQNMIAKQSNKHWTLGLIESMKDPDSIYKKTERVVVIRDKYPKAKIHLLVLPQDPINSIHKLRREHVSLLEEFGELFEMIKAEHENHVLNAGFHIVPSMQRIHMHIISKDMISPCLKTKVHWNTFATNFFRPYEDVLEELKVYGFIQKISNDVHKSLMATPLQCNQCNYIPKKYAPT